MSREAESNSNRIDQMFSGKRERGERASVFYVTAGYPDEATTLQVVQSLEEAGADLIELGIPFSDPIADGPTIQKASLVSLQGGMTVQKVLAVARSIRDKCSIPMIFFSAFNPVLHYGLDQFTSAAVEAGVDGMLIPDLPPEEAGELEALCRAKNLKLVFLVAPTTSASRRELIAGHSTGFIYYISLRGVTGARESLPEDLRSNIEELKAVTSLPVVAGFGISRPEHARNVGEVADGIVIGSALINLIAQHAGTDALAEEIKAFAQSMIEALPRETANPRP